MSFQTDQDQSYKNVPVSCSQFVSIVLQQSSILNKTQEFSVSSPLISNLLSICISLSHSLFSHLAVSRRNVPQKLYCLLRPKFSPLSWFLYHSFGKHCILSPLYSQSIEVQRPRAICQVFDCISHEQVLCLACRCPSSASQQRLQSMFHSLSSLAHTPINKIQQLFILDLKQWAPSLSWVTVHPQNTSRTKTLS